MQVLHPRCGGLDVHKKVISACVMQTAQDGTVTKSARTFGTTVPELLELLSWLMSLEVTHVAMESTGSYWKPVFNILEGHLEAAVVNAQHVSRVPGRKTDQSDAEWLCELHRHGLVRSSFVPKGPQRELRELVRHRTNLMQRRAQLVNELHKVLESTNIKLTSVVTDITGVSATEMLQELLAGKTDPEQLASLARGKLREKKPQLIAALKGEIREHHKLIISQLLSEIGWCQEHAQEITADVERRLAAEAELIERLDKIPGVNQTIAHVIVAEVGTDAGQFPTDNHLTSWAGICPGNHQSGGKRLSGRIRGGNRNLRSAIVQAAQAARRTKGTYLSAKFIRLSRRRGSKRAVVAVGRSILKAVWHMLDTGAQYKDLGADYYERRRNPEQTAQAWVRRIEKLGYKVTLEPLQPAA